MTLKLLIANRGEIAVRIINACRELGIGTVAVYSDADAGAMHVRLADEALRIGPGPALDSYLNQAALLTAAANAGARLIHPGYGFLSENADFADACRAAGLLFIGPSGEAMRRMGDKAAARNLARAAEVPVVEGYDDADQTDARFVREARRIGYPILVKAAMGGGGMAMHPAERPSQLRAVLAQARREARAAFGDERLILERLLTGPRHVEVQIIGDEHGTLLALGERDCSVQRRRQKVIEEAPSPAVDPAMRGRLCDLALRLAKTAGYTNAGTAEFLLDRDGSAYFLEMNARLQVEHAVTEAVYGVDLVRLQIEIALGGEINDTRAAAPRGHAIECRLYAEDPANGFRPSTGRVLDLRLPAGPGIRTDMGVVKGDEISPYYDAMLGKLTVWAPDREAAIRRMQRALADCLLVGVQSNLTLLRRVIASDSMSHAEDDISFLERELSQLFRETQPPPAAFAAAFACELLAEATEAPSDDPWRRFGAWRLGGAQRVRVLRYDGGREEIRAGQSSNGIWHLECAGRAWQVNPESTSAEVVLEQEGRSERYDVRQAGGDIWIASPDGVWLLRADVAGLRRRPERTAGTAPAGNVLAPMPGLVQRVLVGRGENVRAHHVLLVLEAMKMEHAIEAPADGVVGQVHCRAGEMIQAGALLVEFES